MAKRQTIGENPLDNLIQTLIYNGHPTGVLETEEETKNPTQKQNKLLSKESQFRYQKRLLIV